MSESRPARKGAKESAKSTASGKAVKGFASEERAAMRERAQELKAADRRGPRSEKANGESDVLAKIAAMTSADRAIGERLHAIIRAKAPALSPKLWYGMPAYANKDGSVVCFFQDAQKFKTRYATLGFSDKAHLDDGSMWPTAFALKELTDAEEEKIGALLRRAVIRGLNRLVQRKQTASDCFYDFCLADTCQSTPPANARRTHEPGKCKRTMCNPAHGFQSGWFYRQEGQQCLLAR